MFKQYRFCAYVFLVMIMVLMCSVLYGSIGGKVSRMSREIPINWAKLYPFDEPENIQAEAKTNMFMRLFASAKGKVTKYTSDAMPKRLGFVEAAKRYENAIAWNLPDLSDNKGVVKLDGDYFISYALSEDVSENAEAVIELGKFCRDLGIDYLYINYPCKVCKSDDKDISGTLDFSNQNADRFLQILSDNGVSYYDMRETLHTDGMNHHESFYRTDHHWKAEIGLWASRHILEFLRDNYGWNTAPEILNPDNFDYVIYPKWAFGYYGRRVTHARTEPEDFTLIYPKNKTIIHYNIPSRGINTSGDFSMVYDMSQVEQFNIYELYPYTAYNHSDHPLMSISREYGGKDKHILIIKHSFSNCVIPFLALGGVHVTAIDLRHFTGSLRSCIKSIMPDMVITAYDTATPITRRNTGTMNSKFYDFR